jgi:hypothetical protein
MMGKSTFLKSALIVVITFSLISFLMAIYDDDDSAFDFLCDSSTLFLYACFLSVLPCAGLFCISVDSFVCPQSLVSYLASKEKSPPFLFS